MGGPDDPAVVLGEVVLRFYAKQRAKGKGHQAALQALAFKWIRILYRCWVDRVPYDETRYLLTLEKRGSPLLKSAT